jgi:translation initiation factor 2B subunit (eIF-2B alpha/beta/delta family)
VRELKCAAGELEALVNELVTAIKTTEPRITPLIHLIERFEAEMQGQYGGDLAAAKRRVVEALDRQIATLSSMAGQVVANGLAAIKRYDVIIVYSTSAVIREVLVEAKHRGKPFEVLILKQDFTKTRKLIWTAAGEAIDHQVIPEYNLSNFVTRANKFFLGAMSVTPDGKAVCPLGAAEVIGLCHLNQIPVYLFASSLKFSHQTSASQSIHEKQEACLDGHTSYQMTIHSHCIVDLDHVDFIVREDGLIPRAEFATRLKP